ncbi:hypothetical protein [Litorimonas sp. WD9-15]|uniref:hypothetical protein n=1 Tax=Litorimonas sp. WD9-15 TaxID=3418716 RepID=UPI003CFDAE71
MSTSSERLRRALANDADWEARQSQEFDAARAAQAAIDVLALIEEHGVIFMQIRAFCREAAHPGNPNKLQRTVFGNWLKSTDRGLAIAQDIAARELANRRLEAEFAAEEADDEIAQ